MAIYTNYGRFLKAKKFKESLEKYGETYMLFGLGNPRWDAEEPQSMPIAPYNTSILSDNTENNQFYDDHVCQYFSGDSNATPTVVNGEVQSGTYIEKCKSLVPPFPCIWSYPSAGENDFILEVGTHKVTQENYQNHCIKKNDSNEFVLYNNGVLVGVIELPSVNSLNIQYFTEMYIRGIALENGITKPPVGLLGAVKCDINFVKDIGAEDGALYTGDINQFWYGDRYWEIVSVDESDVDRYIDKAPAQEIYPHHLIFTATVNPRVLCEELNIDQYLVPRQIAIVTRERTPEIVRGETPAGDEIVYAKGKNFYRAYSNVFNFGQYATGEAHEVGDILNFTLPCTDGSSKTYPDGEFKFLLNDYIRGQIRQVHTIDRFGYVVGF